MPRRRGGVAGEALDLRLDIEEAFESLEGEVDQCIVVEDEGSDIHSGHVKMNFVGPGVTAEIDPGDPNRVNVTIPGGGGGSGNIQIPFSYASYPGSVPLGTLFAGKTVEKAVLEVQAAFDNVQFIIGDEGARGRLMPADANAPTIPGIYTTEANYTYTVDTPIYLYFIGVIAPTTGAARVIIYFS
jgi:hypothetical protein